MTHYTPCKKCNLRRGHRPGTICRADLGRAHRPDRMSELAAILKTNFVESYGALPIPIDSKDGLADITDGAMADYDASEVMFSIGTESEQLAYVSEFDVSEAALLFAAKSEFESVRLAAAQSFGATTLSLLELSVDPSESVRLAVARHPVSVSSPAIVESMLGDRSNIVSEAMIETLALSQVQS